MSVLDLLPSFATIFATIFVAELADKDALLLLTLATRIRSWTAFAAGSVAFTITSAIIVSVGYLLIQIVPIFWVRLVGGFVMIGFGLWTYFRSDSDEKEEERLIRRTLKKTEWSVFIGAVSLLILLDLAGDATEVLTIVYVAKFENTLLVFLGAVLALILASGVETLLGRKIGKLLSTKHIRLISLVVFLLIGSIIVATTLY
ncbi:MAG: TMEM165/GDT1 family protein [Nitrososphaerota archaeon]|nr:TMEM165/GDT1 family protein [Nitrososphaerota archaeon]MDG6922207.1 TMEM165/GDT1 family protein [Nitrososphaerota archaeon]